MPLRSMLFFADTCCCRCHACCHYAIITRYCHAADCFAIEHMPPFRHTPLIDARRRCLIFHASVILPHTPFTPALRFVDWYGATRHYALRRHPVMIYVDDFLSSLFASLPLICHLMATALCYLPIWCHKRRWYSDGYFMITLYACFSRHFSAWYALPPLDYFRWCCRCSAAWFSSPPIAAVDDWYAAAALRW